MKFRNFSYVLLFSIITFSNIEALPADFEQRTRDIISNSIRLEQEHGDTKFFKVSEHKLQDLCKSLEDESEDRFNLIEKGIRDTFQYGDNIAGKTSKEVYEAFMEGFCDILELSFPYILSPESNPNHLWNYLDFLEDMLGAEREEARLNHADIKAINARLGKGWKPSDPIFAEIELRRAGIIKDRR